MAGYTALSAQTMKARPFLDAAGVRDVNMRFLSRRIKYRLC
jgi:hypothetical protein